MNLTITNEVDMKRLGQAIGRVLVGGECIELVGDVGAGKTTLTKGIAAGLGISETVQSPTFTINRTYNSTGGVRLSHYDFYRLSDPGIMADELRESLDDPLTAIVIEWGDVVGTILPTDTLRITFSSPEEMTRVLNFSASGNTSTRILRSIG
ncbi:tRNA (adenosine(37)-N6)-threonylcarbamoyltransferase complex ATPase subunit type 1 TsaE [Candidatus Saccharibacteria bacterium]|nr:tRNA (adenosine(37)-N6)-threonylcarbamoyltransferase complex ATPase subunit type 1 TsaE [Candidatus Saccharibacteria bacterium]